MYYLIVYICLFLHSQIHKQAPESRPDGESDGWYSITRADCVSPVRVCVGRPGKETMCFYVTCILEQGVATKRVLSLTFPKLWPKVPH